MNLFLFDILLGKEDSNGQLLFFLIIDIYKKNFLNVNLFGARIKFTLFLMFENVL